MNRSRIIHRPSPNWNERRHGAPPDMVILHYTGMISAAAATERLCDPASRVSSHYLIDREGTIVAMVPEELRAWHAGVSSWHGDADINSRSIGIELDNRGHAHGYHDYPEVQMAALLGLLEGICSRHAIAPGHLLAHSDVAPARKQDPGERFDWRLLAREGFGLWVPPEPIEGPDGLAQGDTGPQVRTLQRAFAGFGYGLESTGVFDLSTRQVVEAFQRHWRQTLVDGRADASTMGTLRRVTAAIPIAKAS